MTRLSLDNLINNAIIQGLMGSHEEIPIRVLRNLLLSLITILRHVLIQAGLDKQNLLRLNLNICRLTLRPAQRLMDHNPRIGQGLSLSWSSRPE